MSRKNAFSGLLTVLILALLVFAVIYFFYPEVSMKYYGVAFDTKGIARNAMASAFVDADYLTDSDREAVMEVLSSEEAARMMESVSKAASEGTESIEEAFSGDEAKAIWAKLEKSLSPEKLEKLTKDAGKKAAGLFDRLFR